ncbi:MAG: DMT family transporter [Bacteroidaceae bacterium]|nr:DMT family transporter [Bacteroidaceae bacterium]
MQREISSSENTSTSDVKSQPLFQRPFWVSCFALTAAVVWGWAYPLIKMGFEEFAITPDMTGNKILFAGVRFTFSGLIILAFAKAKRRSFAMRRKTDWWFMLVFALLNTTFHYSTFYIGLSFSAGARAAILNSLSVFLLVIMACIFFKSDRFTMGKVLGCVLGFAGILALNMGGAESGHFTLLGDGMIIVNALCSAVASLLTRSLIKRVDVFVGTGYSLGLGGLLLLVPSLLAGATMPQITWWGLVILLLLIGISALSFVLYNKLISCNPVGKVAIFNSLIPVVGAVTSCLCLGETFYWKYVIAGALATAGIYIINKQK